MRSLLVLLLLCLSAFAQEKPKDKAKDVPPRITVVLPMGTDVGKTTKLLLRGFGADAITEVRFQEPRTTGKVVGKGKKVGVPDKMKALTVGDSEIEIEVTLPSEVSSPVLPFTVVSPTGESPAGSLLVNDPDLPRVAEKEPNEGFKTAMPLPMPACVEGKIERSQDVDVFKIECRKGQTIVVDLQAARYGSPLEGMLTLHDADGRILATAAKKADRADPGLEYAVVADGTYLVSLIDAADQGGSMFVYRLIVKAK